MSQRRSFNSQSLQSSVSTNTKAVNECVRFILYREGSKIPIKRVDIKNHLIKACEIPKNEFDSVIAAAEQMLKNVYGYRLAKEGPDYMVVLQEPCEDSLRSPLVEPLEDTLLNAALAHIFMSGGAVKDDDLWKFLTKAELMKQNDNTVTKLFTKKFTKQLYFTYKKSDMNNSMIFQWGPRAQAETSKMLILQKVAEALGKEPEFWNEQYNAASGDVPEASNCNGR